MLRIDTRKNHPNALPRDTTRDEVVTRAFTDRLEGLLAIYEGERAFGKPYGSREWDRKLLKCGATEEMGHEGNPCRRPASDAAPGGREHGHLVDVLDQNVEIAAGELPVPVSPYEERVGLAGPYPMHFHAVERVPAIRARPSAAQQHRLVPTGGQTTEDLVQVNFGATRQRILPALPIHHRDA